jgi:chaperone required for assembly of F1-ATPase
MENARTMKRFWKEVTVDASPAGYTILLDGRAVKTPMKAVLILPCVIMVDAVKAEWDAVGDDINPAAMPMTGFANGAIDRVAADRQGFINGIAAYGETDLMCYRAEKPEELISRQAAAWDPWLQWAQARYSVTFNIVAGIMHRPQPDASLAKLKDAVAAMSNWKLAAASRLVPISGSLIALLALTEGSVDAETLWPDLIVDELWQEEKWGADEYALKNRCDREADFKDAARFLMICRDI